MDYQALFSAVTQKFEDDFTQAYRSFKKSGRNKLLRHMMSFYRRWNYSALVEDTVLTPANLCDALNNLRGGSGQCITHVPSLNSYTRLGKMRFHTNHYTLDKHPVVSDLKLLLTTCMPSFALDEDDYLLKLHESSLLTSLSIGDPYYVEYLLLLCINFDLITKIPSIHSNHAQVTDGFEAFFALSHREILEKIVDETIRNAARFINEIIPGSGVIDFDYIKSLLTDPVATDDVFKHIYSSFGFSMEQIMDLQDDDILDEMYATVLSSTFYLGVLIDRCFFTPFGFYLKFINPGYLLPCDVAKEMSFAMEAIEETEDISIAMFSPCSHYALTKIGAEFFGVPTYQEGGVALKAGAQPDALLKTLAGGGPLDTGAFSMFDNVFVSGGTRVSSQNVYEIKIGLMDNKTYWKKLELLEESTLHDLYLEVCYEFNFEVTMKYSFYMDISESPFSEYCSPAKKKRAKNAAVTTLHELALPQKHKFVLVLRDVVSPFASGNAPLPSRFVKLEADIVKIKEKDANQLYPRVKSTAQSFRNLDMDWLF